MFEDVFLRDGESSGFGHFAFDGGIVVEGLVGEEGAVGEDGVFVGAGTVETPLAIDDGLGELALLEADRGKFFEELAAKGFVGLAVFPRHENGLAGEPVAQRVEFAAALAAIDREAVIRAGHFERASGDLGRGFDVRVKFGMPADEEGFELIALGLDVFVLHFRCRVTRHNGMNTLSAFFVTGG
jgi:hypothetical protein